MIKVILLVKYNEGDIMKKEYKAYYKKLGLNIAYYRKMRDLTQEQLAEKMDISQTHISKMEVASVGISLDKLFQLAEILKVPPYKLLEFKED